jgi:hypothetical protein
MSAGEWAVLLVLFGMAGLALLVMLVGQHLRHLRAGPPRGCPSVSTLHGTGYDARPAGLLCHRRAGHRYSHAGFSADGRLWTWPQT